MHFFYLMRCHGNCKSLDSWDQAVFFCQDTSTLITLVNIKEITSDIWNNMPQRETLCFSLKWWACYTCYTYISEPMFSLALHHYQTTDSRYSQEKLKCVFGQNVTSCNFFVKNHFFLDAFYISSKWFTCLKKLWKYLPRTLFCI